MVYPLAPVRSGLPRILCRGIQCRKGTIGQFNQSVSSFSSISQSVSDIRSETKTAALGSEGPKSSSSPKGWDYDILVNGGGIVGITFVAKVLQKTSNKLKIGIHRSFESMTANSIAMIAVACLAYIDRHDSYCLVSIYPVLYLQLLWPYF